MISYGCRFGAGEDIEMWERSWRRMDVESRGRKGGTTGIGEAAQSNGKREEMSSEIKLKM